MTTRAFILLTSLLIAACGPVSGDSDAVVDTSTPDALSEDVFTPGDASPGDIPWVDNVDVACDVEVAGTSDGGTSDGGSLDGGGGLDSGALEVPAFGPIVSPRSHSVLPADVVSCPVLDDSSCRDGHRHVCALYDGAARAWAQDVPPMTAQAFTFDRYFDRYHEANGQAMDVRFTHPVLAGTPESEWSQPETFLRYDGLGDAAGWTGTALWAAAGRYAATGTPADYERMLRKLEAVAFLYEVVDVPGLMARAHWAMLPEGAPRPTGHWSEAIGSWELGDGSDGHFSFPIRDELIDRLPDYYTDGVVIDGVSYPTTPRVVSDASRDMYVRSTPGVLEAWDLLGSGEREDHVRELLRTELPCTLNRMKKGRIQHLQENPQVQEAVTTLFAGTDLLLDEGDLDLSAVDTMIFYVLEQPHPLHMDAFDRTCPDGPPMEIEPALDLDARDGDFMLRLLNLAGREQGGGDVPIAFSMHVSVRAADTLFITQWALTAHYLTGDPRYLDFLSQLMTELPYEAVLNTYAALQLPKWCAPHYAPSLGYPSLYNVLARVDRERFPRFWHALAHVAYTEARLKQSGPREDSFFGVLYARMVDDTVDPDVDSFVAHHVAQLATYGMNPDDKMEPDRAYPRDFITAPDPTVPLVEIAPGDPEWAVCEQPATVFGVEIPAPGIDGVPIRARDPLPLPKRIGGTMLWQMDPWMVQRDYGGVGMDRQWPMLGMFTPYWVGRADGTITEGEGLALAWRDTGEACRTPDVP